MITAQDVMSAAGVGVHNGWRQGTRNIRETMGRWDEGGLAGETADYARFTKGKVGSGIHLTPMGRCEPVVF
jgi:hypothetical protein